MNRKEALHTLQVLENASAVEIKAAFEGLYENAKRLSEHAPLESQKQAYRKKLGVYWNAYATLVDISRPEYISKFTSENRTVASNVRKGIKSNKTTNFFKQEDGDSEKQLSKPLPWGLLSVILGLTICGFVFWKVYTKIPEPIVQLMEQMEYISGGSFQMGCTNEQQANCLPNERPVHPVTVSSFRIGKFEVTRAQWYAVMKYYPSSIANCSAPNCPIVHITWDEVQVFLTRLNKMTKRNYRLPTEAEWEYAARGANSSRNKIFSGSDQFSKVGRRATAPYLVGSFSPNEKSLFDMSGNVWEWCSDGFDPAYYSISPKVNPTGVVKNSCKVIRGGGFQSNESSLRVSSRNCLQQDQHTEEVGFRIVSSFIM